MSRPEARLRAEVRAALTAHSRPPLAVHGTRVTGAGWPDLVAPLRGGVVAWLELKADSALSPPQRARLESLRALGHLALVVRRRKGWASIRLEDEAGVCLTEISSTAALPAALHEIARKWGVR